MPSLISWYWPTLTTHQLAVSLSVALFVARGIGVATQQAWPMLRLWRMTSVSIDVVLLSSGIMLWEMLSYNPVQQSWLGIKMLLLLIYIGLGSFALKRGKTASQRMWFFAAALLCVFTIVGIALTRQPLGWMSLL